MSGQQILLSGPFQPRTTARRGGIVVWVHSRARPPSKDCMNHLDRRTFLHIAAYASALATVRLGSGCADDDLVDPMFPQGVASGDPTPDSVLLWTRVERADRLRYEVATDEQFRDVVAAGEADVTPDRDRTIRLDITGLAAG